MVYGDFHTDINSIYQKENFSHPRPLIIMDIMSGKWLYL